MKSTFRLEEILVLDIAFDLVNQYLEHGQYVVNLKEYI